MVLLLLLLLLPTHAAPHVAHVAVLPLGDLSKSMRQHMVDFNFLTYLSARTQTGDTHEPLTRDKPLEYTHTHMQTGILTSESPSAFSTPSSTAVPP